MQETKEISALFTLLDDPDEDVFCTVSNRIVTYGKGIIPNLEDLWETIANETVQSRIERLIHNVHYADLTKDFTDWKNSSSHDLLFGSLLVAKYQYPDLQFAPILTEIEKIKRNIWLELNSYLTPLEQANVVNATIYNHFKLKGVAVNYANIDEYLINKVVQLKKGNVYANTILYLVLAEFLDIPLSVIKIPRQFIIAFVKPSYQTALQNNRQSGADIHFYVEASSGRIYGQEDIVGYLNKIGIADDASLYQPLTNKEILVQLLTEMSKCFMKPELIYKQEELLQLADLLGG